MVAQFGLLAGSVVPWHQHANEQLSVLASGQVRFEFGSAEAPEVLEAGAGDTIITPGRLPHQVTVLQGAPVFDVFAPPGLTGGVPGGAAGRGDTGRRTGGLR